MPAAGGGVAATRIHLESRQGLPGFAPGMPALAFLWAAGFLHDLEACFRSRGIG